jgi:hypothetical protein
MASEEIKLLKKNLLAGGAELTLHLTIRPTPIRTYYSQSSPPSTSCQYFYKIALSTSKQTLFNYNYRGYTDQILSASGLIAKATAEILYEFFLETFSQINPPLPGVEWRDFCSLSDKNEPEIKGILDSNFTNREKSIALLLSTLKNRSSDENVETLLNSAQAFLSKMGEIDFTREEDVLCLIDPGNGVYGKLYYPLMLMTDTYYHSDLRKKFMEESFREFALLLWSASTMNELPLETLLKDVIPRQICMAEIDNKRPRIFDLPLQTAKYRQYLLSKNVEEIRALVGNIPTRMPAAAAIAASEKIFMTQKSSESDLQIAIRTMMAILPKIAHFEDVRLVSFVQEFLIPNRHKVEAMSILKEYFESVRTEDLTIAHVNATILYFLGNQGGKWLVGVSFAETILGLLKSELTAEEIVTIINEVAQISPLSATQWRTFLENKETYRSTPASWWVPVLKK